MISTTPSRGHERAPPSRSAAGTRTKRWSRRRSTRRWSPRRSSGRRPRADIVSMVYDFTSRPTDALWLNAKYRYYDYANKTPIFQMPALVGDFSFNPATAALWENEPTSMKRRTFDADASFTPYRYLALGVGLTREDADRTHRIFETTNCYSARQHRISIPERARSPSTPGGPGPASRKRCSRRSASIPRPGISTSRIATAIAPPPSSPITPIAQIDINASVRRAGRTTIATPGLAARQQQEQHVERRVRCRARRLGHARGQLRFREVRHLPVLAQRNHQQPPDQIIVDATR